MDKEELLKELKEIEEVKLPLVEEKIKEARKHGQLSENVVYFDAREEKASLEKRVEEIKDILSRGNNRQDSRDLLATIRYSVRRYMYQIQFDMKFVENDF